jgi:hypothetical protein
MIIPHDALLTTVFPYAGCSRIWNWPLAPCLKATRWRRDFSFGNRLCRRIPWNVAKRYFAEWYFGAPLIHINRRATSFHSLFRLNYDKIIRALDIFVMPDLAALRTPAIQIDGVRVRFRMTGT